MSESCVEGDSAAWLTVIFRSRELEKERGLTGGPPPVTGSDGADRHTRKSKLAPALLWPLLRLQRPALGSSGRAETIGSGIIRQILVNPRRDCERDTSEKMWKSEANYETLRDEFLRFKGMRREKVKILPPSTLSPCLCLLIKQLISRTFSGRGSRAGNRLCSTSACVGEQREGTPVRPSRVLDSCLPPPAPRSCFPSLLSLSSLPFSALLLRRALDSESLSFYVKTKIIITCHMQANPSQGPFIPSLAAKLVLLLHNN